MTEYTARREFARLQRKIELAMGSNVQVDLVEIRPV